MPDANPLVAQAQSQTTAVTGIGIAESAQGLAEGVSNGDWVEAGLSAVGVGLEVLSMVIDPLGTLASYGVSWLIEHVRPLKEALDWFAGDPPVIQSFSDTWGNVATEVNAIAADFLQQSGAGTSGWTGAAADQYRGHSTEAADALAGAATLADGISVGVMIMGQVVSFVREFIRDLVGELVGKLISWALEEAATLGLATPVVVAQATAAISKVVSKVSDVVRKLVKTIGNVSPRIRKIIDKLDEIVQKLAKLMRKADGSTSPSAARSAGRHADDTPTVHSPDGSTTPSSAHTPDTTTPSSTPDTPSAKPDGGSTPDGSPDGSTSPSGTRKADQDTDGAMRDNGDARRDGRDNDGKCEGGDPIDLATGDMLMVQTDVALPGVLPLVLTRAHISSYRVGGLFGRSWASTLDQRLEVDGTRVWYAAPDGVLLAYPNPHGSTVLPDEGKARWPLAGTPDGGYVITRPEVGQTLHFAAARRLGDVTVLPLTAIVDRNGNRIDLDRDANGTPTQIRHSGGYRIAVDSGDGLVTGLRLLGPHDDADWDDVDLVRYRYDIAGRLVEVTNSSGRPLRFEYDGRGRVIRWTDRNNQWYGYVFDENGRCVRTEGSGGALTCAIDYDTVERITTYTDSLGHVTRYHFNEAWQLVREVDPLGHAVVSEWDRYDRLLARTNPLGHTTRFTYDDAGNQIAITDPDGRATTAEYDDAGLPTVLTRRDGSVWRNEYDERGNLVAVMDPAGAVTRYHVDHRGHPTGLTNALGQTRRVETNAAGLPVAVTDFLGATTRYTRDAFGRVSAVVDPLGGVTRLGWTVEGRLISCTQPDGTTEQWRYDGEGNEIAFVDALGQVTRTEFTHFDLPAAKVDVDGTRLEFRYDTELRLVSVTNQRGLVWHYTYDPAGNLIAETDFAGRTLSYDNDAAGQLVARTTGTGDVTTFRHDTRGNVVEKRAGDTVTTYEFDAVDQMVGAVGPHAELVFERDRLGRVTRETSNGRVVESVYDPLGRRIRRITPGGVETGWEYDGNDQPLGVHVAGHTIRLSYDSAGREVRRQLGGGAMVSQTWDVNHRLTGQQVTDALARPRQRRAYQYRADGAVTGVQDQLAGARTFDLDRSGRVTAVRGAGWTERYVYDESGNVTNAAWPDQQTDDQGGREYAGAVLRRSGNVFYRHDAQGRIVERTRRTLSGQRRTWLYTWDADDRLTGVSTPDGATWRYLHDPLGRRIAKQRLDGDRVVEETSFTWDGVHLAEQSTHGSRETLTTTWDRDGLRPVSQVERRTMADAPQQVVDERFFAIVTDLIGTPTELVDESGGIAWHARRTLWGITSRGAGATADTPLRFPGQYFDAETGLHYNYFRHYDPTLGQYTSADPLGLAGGPNQRSYALNPMAWLDYLGLLTCRQNAAQLRQNMAAEGRAPAPGQAAAHIVPSGGSQGHWAYGARSRDLLDAHGVDINDAANGIPLGHPTPHNYTHRGGFHERVYNRLQGIVSQGQARGLSPDAIGGLLQNELRSIGRAVERELAGGAPGPGAYWTA
jgi:RHS repeat-associated protein